jgi:hypothetical protein
MHNDGSECRDHIPHTRQTSSDHPVSHSNRVRVDRDINARLEFQNQCRITCFQNHRASALSSF